MPLSWYGLWDAEIIAPRALRRAASNATTGVGTTPRRCTTIPSLARPATKAASSIAVDRRVSPPTTASSPPRIRPAARPRSRAKAAVSSLFAMPRTPSVPNFIVVFGLGSGALPRSPLGELRRLAGLLQAVLLALLLARVAREQAGLLQRRA